MTATALQARRVLGGKFGISDTQLNDIVGALAESGIIGAAGPTNGALHAAAASIDQTYRRINRKATRLNINPNADGFIDQAEFARKTKHLDAGSRLAYKALFARSGLLLAA